MISVGRASSSLDLATGGSPTTVTLAGSITAGRDLTAAATIDHTIPVDRAIGRRRPSSRIKLAYSHAWLNDDATVSVADGTTLTAARELALTVTANDPGSNSSQAYAGSVGGAAAADDGGNPNRGVRLGSANDVVLRGIDVGAGSAADWRHRQPVRQGRLSQEVPGAG